MAQPLSKEAKKEVMKDIILKLHQGARLLQGPPVDTTF